MSSITQPPYVELDSAATPENFNRNFRQLYENEQSLASGVNLSLLSNTTLGGFINAPIGVGIGAYPPSDVTTTGLTINVNSAGSQYITFHDSSGQRSSYVLGSHFGLADGLALYDLSGDTMIANFSKQSVRFFQPVVGPVFDVGGALASTLNAATFGSGTTLSTESRIQAAINAASQQSLARVYVPASMYPYSTSSVSFIHTIQMVREGGSQLVYDVLAYGAGGDGVRDDGWAVRAASSAVQAHSGGEVHFPGGRYKLYPLTSTYTNGALGVFSGISNVRVIADGAVLEMDSTRTWDTSQTMFRFTDCTNICVDGFIVTGPTLDITPTEVTGVEFCRFIAPCRNISMPMNKVSNSVAGLILQGGPTTTPSYASITNVNVGLLDIKDCFYGISCQHAGDNVTVECLNTDTVHRSYFVYGVRNHRVNIVSKDPADYDCFIQVNATTPLDTQDIDLTYSSNSNTTRSSDAAARVCLEWLGVDRGALLRNNKLKFNVDHATTGQTGAEILRISKASNNAAVYDTVDRGHRLDGLVVSGSIRGTPHYSAAGLISTNNASTWGSGDTWTNIAFRDLYIESGSTILGINMKMGALAGPLTLENVTANCELGLTMPGFTYPPSSGQYLISNCSFPNLYVHGTSFKAMEHIYTDADIGLTKGMSGHFVTNEGATASVTRTLPAATRGLRFTLSASSAFTVNVKPEGADTIGIGAAGKMLVIPARGSADLRCYSAGAWEIVNNNGPLSYEDTAGRYDLSSNVSIRGTLDVKGASTFTSVSATSLAVTGPSLLTGRVAIGGNLVGTPMLSISSQGATSQVVGSNVIVWIGANGVSADMTLGFTDGIGGNHYISGQANRIYMQPQVAGTATGDFTPSGLTVTGNVWATSNLSSSFLSSLRTAMAVEVWSSGFSAKASIASLSYCSSSRTVMGAGLWGSGLSIGGGGTLIPAISSISSKIGNFVVQGSASSFTGVAWPAVAIGDIVIAGPFQGAAASSVSSTLVWTSLVTVAGQVEFRLSNVSTLVQNQSAQTWVFTRISPF